MKKYSMKIMIIDDEPLIRIGMKTIVPWEKNGYEIVGDVGDGEEAIKLAEITRPDIILVDIVMPGMDGLSLISEIKKKLPEIKFIILSNKESLLYYKQAIHLGVSEYITKGSVNAEDILATVERVAGEIKKKRVFIEDKNSEYYYANQNIILAEYLNLILQGKKVEEEEIRNRLILHNINLSDSCLYILVIAVGTDLEEPGFVRKEKIYRLLGVYNEIINDFGIGFVFTNFEGYITALIGLTEKTNQIKDLEYFCSRLHQTTEQLFDEKISIGISSRVWKIKDLLIGYNEGRVMLGNMFFDRLGENYFFSESEKNIYTDKFLQPVRQILNISSVWEMDQALLLIDNFFNDMLASPRLNKIAVKSVLARILYHFAELTQKISPGNEKLIKIEQEIQNTLENAGSISKLLNQSREIFIKINLINKELFENSHTRIAEGVDEYIYDNYKKKILLQEIADHIGFSSSYISKIYHKQTGQTVTEKIMTVKVLNSVDLLIKNETLSSIAEQLSFSSQSHYIKTFKHIMGKTPGHYIKDLNK